MSYFLKSDTISGVASVSKEFIFLSEKNVSIKGNILKYTHNVRMFYIFSFYKIVVFELAPLE